MKSITEKAQQLGCDKETVRQKCLKCELPCKKVGNTFIVFEPGEIVMAAEVNGCHIVTNIKDPLDLDKVNDDLYNIYSELRKNKPKKP